MCYLFSESFPVTEMISSEVKAPNGWAENAEVPDGSVCEFENSNIDLSTLHTDEIEILRKMTARNVYERIAEETMLGGSTMIQRDAINAAYMGCVLHYKPQIRTY